MARHRFTVASSLSVEDAFARLIDLERVPEWDEGVRNARRIGSDDESDSPLGDRYEVTLTGFDGTPTSAVYRITDVTAPERFVMVGENDEFRAEDELTLRPTEGGCELDYVGTLDLVGSGPPLTAEQLDSMFPKIAAVAEAGLARFLDAPDR